MSEKLKLLIEGIRQTMCRHQWFGTRFQSLTGGYSQKCTKCGKWRDLA